MDPEELARSEKEKISRSNRKFMTKILALIDAMSSARQDHSVYGEVALKIVYSNGKITSARVIEETIAKPEEE